MLVVSSKKTIALDFDGVLHSYKSGWTGNIPKDEPVDGSLNFVKKLLENYNVIIFSSRAKTKEGKDGIKQWLSEHEFPSLEVSFEKPEAVLYIDDRGFRFTGDFEKVLDFLDNNIRSWVE